MDELEVERTPIVYSVVPAGTPKFPRFRVANQHLQYWTGTEWSLEESDGLTYANSNEACKAVEALLLVEHSELPVRRFRAPVYIDLFSDKDVTLEEIQEWLFKTSKLILNPQQNGNGPVEGTLGLVGIEWAHLEEIK